MNEIIPESPDKQTDDDDENSYVPETPQKDGSPLAKSRSVIPIPSFNRMRKSLGVLDNNVVYALQGVNASIDSPKSRKGIENQKFGASKKSPRVKSCRKGKCSNLQKVKVSLFHSKFKDSEPKKPSFSVNAKSFYGSSSNKVPEFLGSASVMVKPVTVQDSKRKRSSGAQPAAPKKSPAFHAVVKKKSPPQAATTKKHKRRGEINCGVGHGIKRPKRKRSSLKNDSMDSNKSLSEKQSGSTTDLRIPIEINVNQSENIDISNYVQSSSLESHDPNRKFFKHSRRLLHKPVSRSATITSLAQSPTIDLLVCKPVNKKPCTDKTRTEVSNIGNDSVVTNSVNEYLGLSEKDGELLIQPLTNQKDIDDWKSLTEGVDLDIAETNVNNLETFDQTEDLLKILEDDWGDSTTIDTISMRSVNNFPVKESNTIEDINNFMKMSSNNIESSNLVCESIENLVSAANNISDGNSSTESVIINLGLNGSVSLPVELSLSASKVIESCNSHLISNKSINEEISTNIAHTLTTNLKHTTENTALTVLQKDASDLLNVLQDDWIPNVEHEENLISLEINTLSLDKPDQNICNSVKAMNKSVELQNKREATEEASKKYYPIFSKGSSFGIVTDTMQTSKKRNENRMSMKLCDDPRQYQIDAGQKLFGITQCKECECLYHIGDQEDEKYHKKVHNRWKKNSILKFQGWKNERIVFEDLNTKSKIILIEHSDPMSHRKKVLDILEIIDIGLMEVNTSEYIDDKVYFYVRNKSIIGLLISKRIHTAFKMIPESSELNCCSTEGSPANCGIEVIWTAEQYRRQGVATKLLDTLRSSYFYGHIMSMDDIAFSIPTPSGKAFAKKYTNTSSFKVY